jgi:putative nucleotidyltransferase with HDIG domain
MFTSTWFQQTPPAGQDASFRENQVLKAQIQELLLLDETGFFIELDSLLRAILKKALILCKADSSFFALVQGDPPILDVRISNLILEEKMTRIREKFQIEFPHWQESESEIITIDDFILLPLFRRHRMLGLIGLKLNADAPENVCEILPVLARQAAASLESAILYERMFKRLLVLSNVFILGKEIVTNIDLGMLVDKFLSIARDGTSSEVAAIFLFHENESRPYFTQLQVGSGGGAFDQETQGFSPLLAEICLSQKPQIIGRLIDHPQGAAEVGKIIGVPLRDTIVLPLKPRDRFLGLIQVANKVARGPYSGEDLDLINILSGQIGFVIQNADLFRNLQRAYIDTLTALTTAIDAKDSYTHGHSERVTQLSLELGQELKLGRDDLENIRIAGILHDIGKIGIPETILNKPGRLSDEEFETIKSHPDLGVKILRKVEFLSGIIPLILHHHERFDGRGYPAGLAGDKIPLVSRIIAVADTFDAMTSDRPYRKALDERSALEEIERCRESQFDPQVADAFLACRRGPATR